MDEPCPTISQIFHMPEMHFYLSLHLPNLHFLLGLGLGITTSADASFHPSYRTCHICGRQPCSPLPHQRGPLSLGVSPTRGLAQSGGSVMCGEQANCWSSSNPVNPDNAPAWSWRELVLSASYIQEAS